MGRVVIAASRRALAAFVLLLAGLLAVWAATFKVWYLHPSVIGGKAMLPLPPAPAPHSDCLAGGTPCVGVSPAWTIPVALAIAAIGLLVVVLLHVLRRGRAEYRAVNVAG
jgi:low affinity Fe/Cu permease